MIMDFNKMCERCLKIMGEDETMYAFSVWDDKGTVKVLQGHDTCVEEMRQLLSKNKGMKLEGESL